jgi:isopentenyl-diphosphate Delta-isomerase
MATREHESITGRKARHIDICLRDETRVQGRGAGFDEVSLIHRAAPELNRDHIRLETEFLGLPVAMPIFISCMTGGSAEGFRVNRNLALAAGQAGIPVGLGSIRVLHRHPELFEQFHIKPWAGESTVIANLGGVQIRDLPSAWICDTLQRLEVQALAVHLNPGQELFQEDGDRDFRGVIEAFAKLADVSPVPLIVKETGFGISPFLARAFVAAGAAAVDVAGAGGTNWLLVESVRGPEERRESGENYRSWGIPTAAAVAALHDLTVEVHASGGIRTPQDVAKALALGAGSAGMALPFIKAEAEGEVKGVTDLIDFFRAELLDLMTLTGAADVESLRRSPLILGPGLRDTVTQLRKDGNWREYAG